jgi:hypothetical protein
MCPELSQHLSLNSDIGKPLPYLAPQTPPSPLRIRLLYNIPYCSIFGLPIYILTLHSNPYQSPLEDSRFNLSTMPPKTRSTPALDGNTPTLDGNTPATRRQNALGSSADETTRSTLAASKPPLEP